MFDADPWPLALLVLRVATVGLLYVFLLTAFRALRADLRASSAPERARVEVPAGASPVGARTRASERGLPAARGSDAGPGAAWDDEYEAGDDGDYDDEGDWVQGELPLRGTPRDETRSRIRPRVWLPITAAILVAAFGGTALLLAGQNTTGQAPAVVGSAADSARPPVVAPDPGSVTVGLAATEDAQVRVTVDGTVEFDGTLQGGERQAWEGSERIQVWTDSGQTLQLAVNGVDLGAYSPAMGHPDWNRIDYGFWPGWGQ